MCLHLHTTTKKENADRLKRWSTFWLPNLERPCEPLVPFFLLPGEQGQISLSPLLRVLAFLGGILVPISRGIPSTSLCSDVPDIGVDTRVLIFFNFLGILGQ